MAGWRNKVNGAVLALVLVLTAGTALSAERRVALVIGNGAYQKVPQLANPANDARAMADALKGLGFTVIAGYDLTIDQLLDRIHAFGQAADGSAIALVFYAGHGLQVAGHNYLLPVDAKLARETDLRREAVELDEVLGEARQAKRLRIVILDACRDNPFMGQMARSLGTRSALVGRGFARVEEVEADTLVGFATKADAVAEDGSGAHSPYTTALLQHLAAPDLTVERFFGKVRDSVVEQTQGRQQPFVYGSLGGEPLYLSGGPATAVPAPAAEPAARSADATELAFWDALKTSTNPADYQAYLDTYPNGRFAALAKVRSRPHGTAAEDASASRMVAPASAPASAPAPEPPARIALAAPPPPPAPTTAGIECGRFGGAADRELCRLANGGDAGAIAHLASLLDRGQGTGRDEPEAARLYRLAADQDNPAAENGLGGLLETGRGLPPDEAAAAKLYRRAADQGFAPAQYNLAVLLDQGRGGPHDEAEAARWYRKAADQGIADAQVSLGLLLESGRPGLPADPAEAARLYRLAADQGHALGQAYLAVLFEQGRGVPKDPAEALRYYRLAATQGNAGARAALQRLGN